jgi:alcohol dehydrogenase, propanol-preferring
MVGAAGTGVPRDGPVLRLASVPDVMQAWVVDRPGPFDGSAHPLVRMERAVPEPGPGEVRVRVRACGVCRTDLHLAEGDLTPRRPRVTPGHEIVGVVDRLGAGSTRWNEGDRIGVPWLAHTCGVCRFCLSARENLCLAPRFTGWDVDGGYADFVVVDEAYAYALPDVFDDVEVAPLLCAGIIGYRALLRANLPEGGRLGIYGFGGSAHLTAQVALARGARVHVMTRSPEAQRLALELGASSAGGAEAAPPEPLDSAILFAPVGTLVPPALAALDRGGTLAVAGIYLSDIPALHYQDHLFEERALQSVTANTRRDGDEFLAEAARIGLRVSTVPYPIARADQALRHLRDDRITGAAVLVT